MIGILILLVSIYLYISGNKRWSILIYLGMLNNGFQVLTDRVIGIKNLDIAFIYMVIICIYSQIYEKPPKDEYGIRKHVYWLFAFMVCSVLFSYIHYGFTFAQILQGSRHLWFFMSFLFLRKLRYKDFLWIFEKLYYITLITAVLYSIQVLFNLPVLPYTETIEDISIDRQTGVARYYNSPSCLIIFLIASIVAPQLIKKFRFSRLCPFILFIALICTQGRTNIGTTIAVIALGILMTRKISNYVRYALILAIVILPFSDILIGRFEGGKRGGTSDDFENIINGKFIDAVERGQGVHNMGTLTYRFAWVYERAAFLSHRPLGENLFGLGLITDSQYDIVHRMYHFKVGLSDERGNISQMSTPDIAWGNMISKFGYLGGILLLLLWLKLIITFYKYRRSDLLVFVAFLSSIKLLFNSFSSAGISATSLLGFYFCILSIIPYMIHKIKRRNETNSIQTITS